MSNHKEKKLFGEFTGNLPPSKTHYCSKMSDSVVQSAVYKLFSKWIHQHMYSYWHRHRTHESVVTITAIMDGYTILLNWQRDILFHTQETQPPMILHRINV